MFLAGAPKAAPHVPIDMCQQPQEGTGTICHQCKRLIEGSGRIALEQRGICSCNYPRQSQEDRSEAVLAASSLEVFQVVFLYL